MSDMIVNGKIESADMSAVVTRCGCHPTKKKILSFLHLFHGQHNVQCPNPQSVEDLGIIASYNASDKV
jgi:hypothetical protein